MIRFASLEDVEQITLLHVENVRRTYQNIFPDQYFRELDEKRYEKAWMRHLCRRDCRTIVFEENGRIEGFAMVRLFCSKNRNGELEYFHVSARKEGEGVGSRLFRKVCGLLASEGIGSMEICCTEGNTRARNFYDRHGAVYVGTYVEHYAGVPCSGNRLRIPDVNVFRPDAGDCIQLHLESEYKKLNEFLEGDYILWGLGEYYALFFQQFVNVKKPVYLFDSNTEYYGLKANGVEIIRPKKTEYPVIITCSQSEEVEKNLLELGYDKMVPFYPWHKYIKQK